VLPPKTHLSLKKEISTEDAAFKEINMFDYRFFVPVVLSFKYSLDPIPPYPEKVFLTHSLLLSLIYKGKLHLGTSSFVFEGRVSLVYPAILYVA
jgi:hypothetical protein